MSYLLPNLPDIEHTSVWSEFSRSCPTEADLDSVADPVTGLVEAERLFAERERKGNPALGKMLADLGLTLPLQSPFTPFSSEPAILENAHEIWRVKNPLDKADGLLLAVRSRSGRLLLLTSGLLQLRGKARLNRWTTISGTKGHGIDVRSLRSCSSGTIDLYECSALRLRTPTSPRAREGLKGLRCKAVCVSDFDRVFWHGSSQCNAKTKSGSSSRSWAVGTMERIVTKDYAITLIARNSSVLGREQAIEQARSPTSPAIVVTQANKSASFDKLKRTDEAVESALRLATRVFAERTRCVRVSIKRTEIEWMCHDPRAAARPPFPALSFDTQIDAGALYLSKATEFLKNHKKDYKADALRRSIDCICRAYNALVIEDQPLWVALAVESLATGLLVHDTSVRNRAMEKFEAARHIRGLTNRQPSENELIAVAMLSNHKWEDKIEFFKRTLGVPYVRKPQADAVRLLRNGVVHAGRLLPNLKRAFAAMHHLEKFWHVVAWALCGLKNPSVDVGRFGGANAKRRSKRG